MERQYRTTALHRSPEHRRRSLFPCLGMGLVLALAFSGALTADPPYSDETPPESAPAQTTIAAEAEEEPVNFIPHSAAKFAKEGQAKAVVIVVDGMVDDVLYKSIQRRTEEALAAGATTIIYQIDTYGGWAITGREICDYFIQTAGSSAHTVAYIPTKAISAGAMISVGCQDIIMKKNSSIGDCAPISPFGNIEETEREKSESPLREKFKQAAETNGYPAAICEAMVTIKIEVFRIKNNETGKFEYFKGNELPENANRYDLDNKKKIDSADRLVMLSAKEAHEYGIARTVVDDVEGVLKFIEERDGVTFERPAAVLKTTWSEELVRFLASPTVTGILFLIALLGIYTELNTPGVGLPGAVALVALAMMFGSKFLIGMANWWEIAVFVLGMGLLMVEIFVIPGFGVTGIAGIVLMVFGLGAMLVPGNIPVPQNDVDWDYLKRSLQAMGLGFAGFLVGAFFISKYLPKIPYANRMILAAGQEPAHVRAGVTLPPVSKGVSRGQEIRDTTEETPAKVGQRGRTLSQLRPAGRAMINGKRVDVVTEGSLIEADVEIIVITVEGNRVVVRAVE